MRQIILDTETTGLEHIDGHRIIEIGVIEIVDRRITGERFHRYLNPEREIDAGALNVHGISQEFLADKQRFVEIVEEFVSFIKDAELIIHNAPFDVGFLDAELALIGAVKIAEYCQVVDSLELARSMHPGMQNSLNALCRRYEVDNAGRKLHGALLDAELLAEVYLAMTGGQTSLSFRPKRTAQSGDIGLEREKLPDVVVVQATEIERHNHEQRLQAIRDASGRCLWLD